MNQFSSTNPSDNICSKKQKKRQPEFGVSNISSESSSESACSSRDDDVDDIDLDSEVEAKSNEDVNNLNISSNYNKFSELTP